jgi:hypothetical protein
LAENRFLETVEQVERWKKLHEEIVDSHSYAVRFLRQWLTYARDLAKEMTEGKLSDQKTIDGNGEEEFLELYAGAAEGNALSVEIADFLSCKDPLREDWSPDGLWKAALVLLAQGRADEARRFMKKAYESLEGKELPSDTISSFFKDWGRMAAADDLCVFPQTEEAVTLFANAKEHLPDDPEISALQKSVMGRQKNLVLEFQKLQHTQKDEFSILLQRNAGENALLEGNLYKALLIVDGLVWDNLEQNSASVVSYLQWLMKTASNCRDAADQKIADLSEEILGRIISKLPLLLERKINFPIEFLSYMTRKGIKFSIDSSDNQTDDQ